MEKIRYPSKLSKDPYEKYLGGLVQTLRRRYKQGRLSKEEITLCESIPGWRWSVVDPNRENSYITRMKCEDRHFIRLKRWVFIHNKLPVASAKTKKEMNVYKSYRYFLSKYYNGKMSKEEKEKIDSIHPDLKWSKPKKRWFKTDYSINEAREIIKFRKKKGYWPKGTSKNEREKELGLICYKFRAYYLGTYQKTKAIDIKAITLLNAHPDWYWTKEEYRTLRIKELLEHYEKTKTWIKKGLILKCRIKENYRDGLLTQEQIDLLESNPAWTWERG